jgi:GPH family glycoside/pentoside/hexuronide:cation symporter
VGLLGALPRLTDALTDPLMGYISDHTKSRWGRRRPYIFLGAIASGLLYVGLWWLPTAQGVNVVFWYVLIGSIVFYLAYTMFATPWVALGYELTPDYNERTRLMGVQNFIGPLAYVVSPYYLWVMSNKSWFDDQIQGAFWLAVAVGVVAICLGILPALILREPLAARPAEKSPPGEAGEPSVRKYKDVPAVPDPKPAGLVASLLDFFDGLRITVSSRPFLLLGGATFLVFNGFILISSFQSYVIIYYVFGGDQERGAEYVGHAGVVGGISTFVVIALVTWLGTRIGKRKAFFVTIGVSAVGYALKWFCYSPANPWLVLVPAPLMAFGLGGLFTLMGSMIADVVDVDELNTGERREGMYGSIFWWVVKLGMAAALAGGGLLLNLTGFDVELGGDQAGTTITMLRAFDAFIPAAASLLAIALVYVYPITEQTAHEVRTELERRRGGKGAVA